MAVFILRTHYPCGRTCANICSSSDQYASQVSKRTQDALYVWTNFSSKYVLNDALRKVAIVWTHNASYAGLYSRDA